jgi:hypothetical protein
MVDLKLYEKKTPVHVTTATIFNVVKAIIAAGKETEFLAAAKEANVVLEAGPEAVNFVKRYLFDKKLHENNEAMSHIVAPAAGAPSCF